MLGADIGAFASPAHTPPSFFLCVFLFRDCAFRAISLNSLVSIRRTDARRTQTLTRDQGNGIRDLALFPFLRTLSSFYVRFMRYVSVLYLTLTSFRFRDERRQRGARVTRTPSAVEEPPSRSRALFHPSSSFHYLILFALSCNSYPLISTHIPFDSHSTSILVPPSLSSGASRCSRGFTPHRSLVMLLPLHHCTSTPRSFLLLLPLYGMLGPSPFTHTLNGSLRPPRALSLLCKTAPLCHP